VWTLRQTNPIWAAGGRDWGLEIADWGFEDARYASSVWTPRQTNPICRVFGPKTQVGEKTNPIGAAQAAAIGGWAHEIRDTIHEIRVHGVDAAPNKPNFAALELEMEVPLENKPNLASPVRTST
jgi:hypothetical protein